jgi:uncharacterized protein YdhG (YjbR/CyaY superfamily)
VVSASIDEYVEGLVPQGAAFVTELRRRAHAVRDDVTEAIRYDIPTFQVDGRSRVHVAAWKKHASIYPVPAGMADELAPYVAGKGTLRFDYGAEVPWELVDRVLRALLQTQ